MSADARVVITGLGVVCPIGIGRSEVWENFRAGKSGLSPITSFDTTGLKARVCGEIVGFEPAEYVKPRKALKVMARDAQLTVAAAAMARDDAALPVDSVDPERFGVIFGGEVIRNPLTEVAQPFIGSMENCCVAPPCIMSTRVVGGKPIKWRILSSSSCTTCANHSER